jgi:branched-chain amino acid transport system ATP-binding protein
MGVGLPKTAAFFPAFVVVENLEPRPCRSPPQCCRTPRHACRTFARLPLLSGVATGTTLSGGEQRCWQWHVPVGEPRLLLIDEPSEGLAPLIVDEIYAVLAEMKRAGAQSSR